MGELANVEALLLGEGEELELEEGLAEEAAIGEVDMGEAPPCVDGAREEGAAEGGPAADAGLPPQPASVEEAGAGLRELVRLTTRAASPRSAAAQRPATLTASPGEMPIAAVPAATAGEPGSEEEGEASPVPGGDVEQPRIAEHPLLGAAERRADDAATPRAAEACDGRPVDLQVHGSSAAVEAASVLLCLDTSFAMHAPVGLAHRPVADWDEAAWDDFGKHLRARAEPCRLDPLGLSTLGLLGSALEDVPVEVRVCAGADEAGSLERHCPLDSVAIGRRWKRALHARVDLWGNVVQDVEQLHGQGLRSVVVVTGTEDLGFPDSDMSASGGSSGSSAEASVERLARAGLPIHVVALGAPGLAHMGEHIASATSGSFTALQLDDGLVDSEGFRQKLAGLLRRLRRLPRAAEGSEAAALVKRAGLLRATVAARRLQRQVRAHLLRQRQAREAAAARRIAGAYGRYRLRCSMRAAALEGRRARKRAPVEAALRRRAALQQEANVVAAARRIQSEWRARRVRLWCQRADRAAQRLQRWCRRRWLVERLLREAERLGCEASRSQARKNRQVDLPGPPPVSQLPKTRVPAAAPHDSAAGEGQPRTPRAGALLACPPPLKKPTQPKDHAGGGGSAGIQRGASHVMGAGCPTFVLAHPAAVMVQKKCLHRSLVGSGASGKGGLPPLCRTLPSLQRSAGLEAYPGAPKPSPRRALDGAV